MAELEIHHEAHHDSDPLGKRIGIFAAIVAMTLAIVSIASHRAHTQAVLLKTDANDKWSYYEAQRMKYHNIELGEDILASLPAANGEAARRLSRYEGDKDKYEKRSRKAQEDAEAKEKEADHMEETAFRFDVGEGLLEIGLVMTSLYFVSKRTLFPVVGVVAAVAGVVMAVMGFTF